GRRGRSSPPWRCRRRSPWSSRRGSARAAAAGTPRAGRPRPPAAAATPRRALRRAASASPRGRRRTARRSPRRGPVPPAPANPARAARPPGRTGRRPARGRRPEWTGWRGWAWSRDLPGDVVRGAELLRASCIRMHRPVQGNVLRTGPWSQYVPDDEARRPTRSTPSAIRTARHAPARGHTGPAGRVRFPAAIPRPLPHRTPRGSVRRLLTRVWRLLRPFQSPIMALLRAKFVVGAPGWVRGAGGGVLIIRRGMWRPGRRWGLPSGFAHKGEDFRRTVVGVVKGETGLDVEAGRLVMLNSGLRTRLEVAYEARLIGGEMRLDTFEILEARWCRPDDLPEEVQPVCHPLVRGETTP